MTPPTRCTFLLALSCLLSTPFVSLSDTWDGGGTNDNWGNAGNWVGNVTPVPSTTTDLVFTGALRLNTNNNNVNAFINMRDITFDAGASAFTLGGNSVTLNGSLRNDSANLQTVNLDLSLPAGDHFFVTNTANIQIDGSLSGIGKLIKTQAQTLFLNGNGTATGETEIRNGTITLGHANAIGTGLFTMLNTNDGTLELNGFSPTVAGLTSAGTSGNSVVTSSAGSPTLQLTPSGALTYSDRITGSLELEMAGSGAQTLSGNNSYSGGTKISSGTVVSDSNNALGTGTISLAGGGASLTVNDGVTLTNQISLTNNGNQKNLRLADGVATAELSGAITVAETGVGNVDIQLGDDATDNNPNRVLKLSGNISHNTVTSTDVAIQVRGDGVLELSGNNSITGIIDINHPGTTVRVGSTNGLGGADLHLRNDNAILEIADGVTTNANSGLVVRAFNFNKMLRLEDGATSGAFQGPIAIEENSGGRFDVSVPSGGTLTLSGAVTSSNNAPLKKIGDGTAILSGNNSYVGNTVVSAGTLRIDSDTALGTTDGDTTVQDGGRLRIQGNRSVTEALKLNGTDANGALDFTGGDSTVSGAVDLQTDASVFVANTRTSTLSGVVSGAGGVLKYGNGVLVLDGANTFDGDVTLSEGFIRVNHASGLGSTTGTTTVANGARLRIDGGLTIAETLKLNGTGTNGALLSTGSANEVSGNVVLQSDSAVFAGSGNSVELSGVVSGSGNLIANGPGTVILSGANSFNGNVTVSSGIVRAENSSGLGSTTGNTSVTDGATLQIQGSLAVPETLTLNGTAATNGALNFAGGNSTVSGGVVLASDASVLTDSGITGTLSGVVSGSGQLVKAGPGKLVLAGNNLYSGGTNVTDGGLQIGNGGTSGTLPGDVSLAAGTTLAFKRSDNSGYPGIISGAGNVRQEGAGQTTLSGANSYTGATLVADGILRVTNDAALGAISAGTTVLDGGSLRIQGDRTIAEPVTLNGLTAPDGALRFEGSGTGTLTGPITLQTDAAVSVAVTRTATLAGIVSGSGSLLKKGSGTLVVSAANTYSGGTEIASGVLELGASGSILGNVNVSGAAGQLSFKPGSDFTFAGDVTGTGGIKQEAPHTVTLTGNNTFAGETVLKDGVLKIGVPAALSPNSTLVFNGGTIDYGGDTTVESLKGDPGTSTSIEGIELTINTPAAPPGAGPPPTFPGVIEGDGDLLKDGKGQQDLTGQNTYTGKTTIPAGTLGLGSDSALGSADGETVVEDGGSAKVLPGVTYTTPEVIHVSGAGPDGDSGALAAGGTSAWAGGDVILEDDATIHVDPGTDFTVDAPIKGDHELRVRDDGSGAPSKVTLLDDNNDYGGGTKVDGNTELSIGNGGPSGSLPRPRGAVPTRDRVELASPESQLTINLDNSQPRQLDNPIKGPGKVTKDGTSELTIGGTESNTHTGESHFKGGRGVLDKRNGARALAGDVRIGAGAELAHAPTASNYQMDVRTRMRMAALARWELNGKKERIQHLEGDGGDVELGSADGEIELVKDSGEAEFKGQVKGDGTVRKRGNGIQRFGGNQPNTQANTRVEGGVLIADKSGGAQAARNVHVAPGGEFRYGQDASNYQLHPDAHVALEPNAKFDLNGKKELISRFEGSGGELDVGGASGGFTFGDATDAGYQGTISGSAPVTKQGSGTQTIGGAESNTNPAEYHAQSGRSVLDKRGDARAWVGDVRVGPNAELAHAPTATNYQLDPATRMKMVALARWKLNGKKEEIRHLEGDGGEVDLGSDSDEGEVAVRVPAGTPAQFDGETTGRGQIRKRGAGIQRFGGNRDNTHTGDTVAEEGEIVFGKTGDAKAAGGNVVVEPGATVSYGDNATDQQLPETAEIVMNAPASPPPPPGPSSARLAEDSAAREATGAKEPAPAFAGPAPAPAAAVAVFDLNGKKQTIAKLAGTGGELRLTGTRAELTAKQAAASARFDGRIRGEGKFRKEGAGEQILGGNEDNDLRGEMHVRAGRVLLDKRAQKKALMGNLRIEGGEVKHAATASDYQLAATTKVRMQAASKWKLNGKREKIRQLDGDGGEIDLGSSSGGIEFDVPDGIVASYDGQIMGAGTITKSGLGEQQLGGDNSGFLGNYAVTAGTLTFSGLNSVGSPSRIDLASGGALHLLDGALNSGTYAPGGGTFAGVGAILLGTTPGSGTFSAAGTTFAPGNSPGTTPVTGNYDATGLNYLWELDNALGTPGSGWDLITVDGDLTVGAFDINISGLASNLSDGDAFEIITATGTVSGIPSFVSVTDSATFGVWTPSVVGDSLVVTFAAIPEPSTWAMLGLLLGLVGWSVRRSRAKATAE